jgi:hypothetical protein
MYVLLALCSAAQCNADLRRMLDLCPSRSNEKKTVKSYVCGIISKQSCQDLESRLDKTVPDPQ